MENEDKLIEKFRNLNIQQQRIILNLVDEFAETPSNDTNVIERTRESKRKPIATQFRSVDGTEINIGDTVKILNDRKTGKTGDTGTVLKFNKKFVAIRLHKNRSFTQRAGKIYRGSPALSENEHLSEYII